MVHRWGFAVASTLAAAAIFGAAACGTESESEAPACDAAEISEAGGHSVTVLQCYGDWALVTAPGPGDAQSLWQRRDGSWTRYSDFPSPICQEKAQSDGVPEAVLGNFTSTEC